MVGQNYITINLSDDTYFWCISSRGFIFTQSQSQVTAPCHQLILIGCKRETAAIRLNEKRPHKRIPTELNDAL